MGAFDDFTDDADELRRKAQAGMALRFGAESNPDQAAQHNALAKRYGLPLSVVQTTPDEFSNRAKFDDAQKAIAGSPKLQAWLTDDATRAAIAHDDMPIMGAIERKLRQFGGGTMEAIGMAAGGTGQVLDIAQRNIVKAVAGAFLPKPALGGEATADSLIGPLIGEDWRNVGGATKGYARTELMVPAAQQTFGDQVTSGLGQVLGQIMMLPFARGAGIYAQGADVMAEKVAPDIADQGLKDLAILGGAGITGVTEKWALDKLLGPLAVPIKNQIAASVARIGIAGAAEGGQEFSENLLHDTLRVLLTNSEAPIDVGQSLQEGGVGVAVGGIVRSLVEAGLHIRLRGERQVQRAQADAVRLQDIGALSANASALRSRDPEMFKSAVETLAEGSDLQEVYIDARTLMEAFNQAGVPLAEVQHVLPDVAKDMAEGIETNGLVKIGVAEYATHIAGGKADAAILPNLKADPEGMTFAESQSYYQDQAAQLQAVAEKLVIARADDAAFQAERQTVFDQVLGQLTAANRFTPDVNTAYATLARDFYVTTADKLGIKPGELLAQHPLTVAVERMTGGQFDQVSYNENHGLPNRNLDGTLDAAALRDLRREAAGLESPERGTFLTVTDDGRAVATGQPGTRIPETFTRFAAKHGLTFDARRVLAKTIGSVGKPVGDMNVGSGNRDVITPMSQPMPIQYRESGAMYFGEAGAFIDRTGKTLFQGSRDLIVQHNLSAENLLHAFKMGGIPVPSLAVTKKDHPLSGFGEITLLGSQEMADPKGYAGTKVFGADIYSPRYPSVKLAFTPNMQKRAEGMLKDGMAATGVTYIDWSEVGDRGVRELETSPALLWQFLKGKGVEPAVVRREPKPLVAAMQPFANDTRNVFDLIADPAFIEAAWQAHTDVMTVAYGGDVEAARAETAQTRKKGEDRGVSYTVRQYANSVEAYQRDVRAAGKIDVQATRYALEQQVREAGLEAEMTDYAGEFLQAINPDEKIRTGSDSQGRPRYIPHTLENVVKILKKELRGGENFNYGVGNIRAMLTPQFKSIEQIRKAKGRLMDKAAFEKVKDEIDAEFFALSDQLATYHPVGKEFRFTDSMTSMMYDAAKMGVPRALKENGFSDVPAEDQQAIAEYLNRLRTLPTEYFEAKILREVDLAEFSGAVVPEGVNPKVLEALAKRGIKDVRTYKKGDETDRAAKIAEFEHLLFQGNRGAYNPSTNTIALLKGADLSTFLHELGHHFLEMSADLASQPNAPVQIRQDFEALLAWFGVKDLNEWHALDFEEKRSYHEQFARGFESYLFEGNAPSVELQTLFGRFRAWLVNVYKSLASLKVELTDDVRGVMDRMLASEEAIKATEAVRGFAPLFESAEAAGMTPEQWAAYQALGKDATENAVEDLETRSLRDMRWLSNAKNRTIKALQQEAQAKRRDIRSEVSKEVWSQPVYQAWQFLTAKENVEKAAPTTTKDKTPEGVDPSRDSMLVAIAKLGGIKKEQLVSEWGMDPKEKPDAGLFGKPVARAEGKGLTLDEMGMALAEQGYLTQDEHGKHDQREFEDKFFGELRGSPQYSSQADYDFLQNGPAQLGVDDLKLRAGGRLDTALVRAIAGNDIAAKVEALRMTRQGALHPDLVAELVGFTSGDEMIRALAEAQRPREMIEGLTDQRMLERYGELSDPQAIERAAEAAIHNEARGRFVATELKALNKSQGPANAIARAAKATAETSIAAKRVRDVRPAQYTAAEAKAARNAQKALLANDIVAAANEKRAQLLNNHLARAAGIALEDVRKGIAYLKKFDNDGSRKALDADYLDQIDSLLERFDLRQGQSLKAIDKRKTLAEWLKGQRDAGIEPEIPAGLENEALRKSFKDMTVEEFRGLLDTVKQIEHLGRLKHLLLTTADRRAYEAVRDEIAASIEANAQGRTAETRTPTTNTGRAVAGLKRFFAAHRKAAMLARTLDGEKDGGPMWEYFVRNANERGDQEATQRAGATQQLTTLLAPVFKLGKMGGAGQFFPSIGRSLNREARLTIAMNAGNAGNLQRLLDGEGWSLGQIKPVLETLTATEWQAVQAVWDHFESYRPQIAAKERRVYGKEPQWIEAAPFLVRTADEVDLQMRGGYYPIKYDPAASQRAEEHADAEGAKRQLQGAYTSATTRRSFTKTRAEEVKGRPLLYSLAGLYSGVNDVIHDLAWHEWLIDVNRLMRSTTIDNAIREHYGPETKAQFKDWIRDIAEGEQRVSNAGEAALSRLRQGVSAAGLGFNVVSALMQPLGMTQSIVRIGARWAGKGIARYLAHPVEASRQANALSEFMANRSRTRFRELNELRNKVEGKTAVMDAVQGNAYFLMMRFQQAVDVPTWWGAYEKALAGGNAERRAIALADQAVIDSQGGGMLKDLSAIERGGPALKLFTVFYSFMNMALNLGVNTAMSPAGRGRKAADLILVGILPPMLAFALKQAITPGGDDEEWDMEKLARKLLAAQIDYLMGMMVVGREFAEVGKQLTGANDFGRDYQGPAGLRLVSDTVSLAKQVHQGEFDTGFRKAAINVTGDLFGLPAAQVNRTITGVEALAEGETNNPAAIAFGFQKPR